MQTEDLNLLYRKTQKLVKKGKTGSSVVVNVAKKHGYTTAGVYYLLKGKITRLRPYHLRILKDLAESTKRINLEEGD